MPNDLPDLPVHGARLFPGLRLDACSLDLPEGARQVGDRASHKAFDRILAGWRRKVRRGGPDPFGPEPEEAPARETLDATLAGGSPEAAGILHGAIEDYAGALADVVRRFLQLPEWAGTERIVVGGGLRTARTGEVAIGRAAVLLRAEGLSVRLTPIRHHPDEAGLIGAARLLPRRVLEDCDAVLTADLGGTSFRAGVVLPRLGVAPDLAAAGVWRSSLWRHADEEKLDRATAIGHLAGLLGDLASEAAAAGLTLAPVVAVGVPGVMDPDGHILRGAENLPGDWQEEGFRAADALARLLPLEGGGHPLVVLHNDAVAQGLSEAPFLRDVVRWGVLTVGTGLGNARFTTLPRKR
jgi:hypothetical protein